MSDTKSITVNGDPRQTSAATIAALALSKVLVTPPASSEQTNLLLDDGATHDS